MVTVGAGGSTEKSALALSLPPDPVTVTTKLCAPEASPVKVAVVAEHGVASPSSVQAVVLTDPLSL
jgi:hypothetical protein